MASNFAKDLQYYKFCMYGFLKNLKFFDPFLILFLIENNINYAQIGGLYAIREIAANVFEIPSGIIADVVGRRRSMIMAFAAYIVSFFLFYISSTYSVFLLAMVFFAFGQAFRSGTHKSMIYSYLEHKGWAAHKVQYYGYTRSWSQAGAAISSIIAVVVVFVSGNYRFVFLVSIIPFIMGLLLMFSYPAFLDKSGTSKKKNKSLAVVENVFSSLKDIEVRKVVFSLSSYSAFYKAAKDYLQTLILAFGLSLSLVSWLPEEKKTAVLIGIVYFIIYVLSSISSRKSSLFASHYQNNGRALNASLLAGFGFGVFSGLAYIFEIYWLAIIFYVMIYLIENIRKPIGVAVITDKFDKEILTTALSVQSQVQSIFTAALALLIGIVAEYSGVGYAILVVSGIFVLLLPLYRIE